MQVIKYARIVLSGNKILKHVRRYDFAPLDERYNTIHELYSIFLINVNKHIIDNALMMIENHEDKSIP